MSNAAFSVNAQALHTPPRSPMNMSMVTVERFREAMSSLAAAVHVVTTDGPAGRAGFTASAVCSVTDSPPTLLVCLNRNASAWPAFRDNDVLCVNTLGHTHEAISNGFGGRTPMDERFDLGQWGKLSTGAPVLEGALAAFDCRIVQRVVRGTHEVLFCEIVALQSGSSEQHGLVYCARRYHHLPR